MLISMWTPGDEYFNLSYRVGCEAHWLREKCDRSSGRVSSKGLYTTGALLTTQLSWVTSPGCSEVTINEGHLSWWITSVAESPLINNLSLLSFDDESDGLSWPNVPISIIVYATECWTCTRRIELFICFGMECHKMSRIMSFIMQLSASLNVSDVRILTEDSAICHRPREKKTHIM